MEWKRLDYIGTAGTTKSLTPNTPSIPRVLGLYKQSRKYKHQALDCRTSGDHVV